MRDILRPANVLLFAFLVGLVSMIVTGVASLSSVVVCIFGLSVYMYLAFCFATNSWIPWKEWDK